MHRGRALGAALAVVGVLAGGLVANASASEPAPPNAPVRSTDDHDLATMANGVPVGFNPGHSAWTSNEHGYVVGRAPCGGNTFCEVLVSTSDGGETWTEEALPTLGEDEFVHELYAAGEGDKETLAVVAGSKQYARYDGATWREEDFGGGDPGFLHDVALIGDYVYAATGGGDNGSRITRARPGSGQWEPVPGLPDVKRSSAVLAARDDVGMVLTTAYDEPEPTTVTTTVDGSQWSEREVRCEDDKLDSSAAAVGGRDTLVMVCTHSIDSARVLVSGDDGQTFTEMGRFKDPDEEGVPTAFGDTILAPNFGGADYDGCSVAASYDRGRTWSKTVVGVDKFGLNMEDLHLTDAEHGTALCANIDPAEGGDVYRTTDGGKTWKPLGLNAGGDPSGWLDPVSSSWTSSDTGYVFGWKPCDGGPYCAAILATEDGGKTWSERPAPALTSYGDYTVGAKLFFVEQDGVSVGVIDPEDDLSYASYDGGKTWRKETFGFDTTPSSVTGMELISGQLYVSGFEEYEKPMLVRAPFGEDAWESVDLDTMRSTRHSDLSARGESAVYLRGGQTNRPPLLYTSDGGDGWTEREIPCGSPTQDQSYLYAGESRIYAVCRASVMVSEDNGATFTRVGDGPEGRRPDTLGDAVGDNIVLAHHIQGAPDCAVQVSSDGGKSFDRKTLSGKGTVQEIRLGDDGVGAAVCTDEYVGGSVVSRTTDGGNTWKPLKLTD